jgi:hypothetical protein
LCRWFDSSSGHFSKKNKPEKKPPAWLLSRIEVKRDAAREPAFRTTTHASSASPERIPVLAKFAQKILPEKEVT